MPSFIWRCLACGTSNEPAVTQCVACGCSATPNVVGIEAAQQAHLELPGVQQLISEAQADRVNPFAIIGFFLWPLLAFFGLWPSDRGRKK